MTYQLLRVEDTSYRGAVRYGLDVLVDEPGLDVDELAEVARTAAAEFRARTPYQALTVGLYDYPEFVGHGYSLGSWLHAPFGDIARAPEVRLGKYDVFEEDASKLRAKPWEDRPSQDDVRAWARWHEVVDSDDDSDEAEHRAYEQVAREGGVTVAAARDAVTRVSTWIWSSA